MAAESVGRKLGIGLRLATKAIQQRVTQPSVARTAGQSQSSPGGSPAAYRYQGTLAQAATDAVRTAVKAPTLAQGVGRGAKRFGQAIWGPMAHTGSVLSLEISGLFFGLFTLFFGQNLYRMRSAYRSGPEHTHFVVYSMFTLIFAWFAVSNFYQARRKERRNRARRAAVRR